ncbi:MAG TPA: DUF3352 domain-containing protein [Marmoricola sp.]|jgi:hypothetical protein|nr:DUF3352 domain-containing protein [Marmoricola sp.]
MSDQQPPEPSDEPSGEPSNRPANEPSDESPAQPDVPASAPAEASPDDVEDTAAEDAAALPDGTEPTAVLPAETSAAAIAEPTDGRRRTRRTAIITAVAVAVVAVLGGGAYAVYTAFFGGGPQPADVLPSTTVAMMSVDLDPSAGQKIAAIRTIRRFPSLKKDLGLHTQDDLRRFIFDKVVQGGKCPGLTYDKDMKPWVGKRGAVAAVDLGGAKPVPAIALQVTDRGKAKTDFAKIAACATSGDGFGFAIGDHYLIASDTTAHAAKILAEGKKKPLADNASYKKWTDQAGDRGVATFYISKKAVGYLADNLKSVAGNVPGLGSGSSADPFSTVQDQLKDFQGIAGTIRFAGGGMEMSLAGGGLENYTGGSGVGSKIGALPKDTAIAAGIAVPKDYAKTLVANLKASVSGKNVDLVTEIAKETGLELPDDLQTLLGSAITLSVGGDAPPDLKNLQSLADIPLGLTLHGDGGAIKDLIATAQEHLGATLADYQIGVESSASEVVLSPSKAYADALLEKGTLGSSSKFTDVVPNADRASAIIYVDFDSAWRSTLVNLIKDFGGTASEVASADANTAPLKSLGISTWVQGSTSHFLLKVATD